MRCSEISCHYLCFGSPNNSIWVRFFLQWMTLVWIAIVMVVFFHLLWITSTNTEKQLSCSQTSNILWKTLQFSNKTLINELKSSQSWTPQNTIYHSSCSMKHRSYCSIMIFNAYSLMTLCVESNHIWVEEL